MSTRAVSGTRAAPSNAPAEAAQRHRPQRGAPAQGLRQRAPVTGISIVGQASTDIAASHHVRAVLLLDAGRASIARPQTMQAAMPRPCAARAAISTSMFGAIAPTAAPTAYSGKPAHQHRPAAEAVGGRAPRQLAQSEAEHQHRERELHHAHARRVLVADRGQRQQVEVGAQRLDRGRSVTTPTTSAGPIAATAATAPVFTDSALEQVALLQPAADQRRGFLQQLGLAGVVVGGALHHAKSLSGEAAASNSILGCVVGTASSALFSITSSGTRMRRAFEPVAAGVVERPLRQPAAQGGDSRASPTGPEVHRLRIDAPVAPARPAVVGIERGIERGSASVRCTRKGRSISPVLRARSSASFARAQAVMRRMRSSCATR